MALCQTQGHVAQYVELQDPEMDREQTLNP